MSARAPLLGAALALLVGGYAARGGDPVAADALWEWAQEQAGDDLADPVYIDAARELSRVRPWQRRYAEARARVRAVERARRSALR